MSVFKANPKPVPLTLIRSSTRINADQAHKFLTAYIERAPTDPAYQPDSTLSAQGPISAGTDAAPNLVIHRLKRVQAGLAGEVLGRDVTLDKKLSKPGRIEGGQGFGGLRKKVRFDDEGEWQDRESFERAQADLVQPGGEENTATKNVEREVIVIDDDDEPAETAPVIDKEERKRKKKERRKAEQRARTLATS